MKTDTIDLSSRLFSRLQLLTYPSIFLIAAFFIQRAIRVVCPRYLDFDCPYYFPISIFEPRLPNLTNLVVALAAIIFFGVSYYFLSRYKFGLKETILTAFILVCLTTLTQGWIVGFYSPLTGDARSGVLIPYSLDGQEYYHDAIKIKSPYEFFSNYNEIQPTLHTHGHTHPPGATLLFYFFSKIFGNEALISIFIAFLSIGMSAAGIYLILKEEISKTNARYFAYIFTLLPVVHIYYLATIDALVSSIVILTVYFCRHKKFSASVIGVAALLVLAQLLTFVSLFIWPVVVGIYLIQRRDIRRSICAIGVVGFVFLSIYFITGYNHYEAFKTASHYENPIGFMGFVNPVNYLFTRFEDIAEIVVFFGPFLSILFVRSFKTKKMFGSKLFQISLLGMFVLLAMFLTGAFRTGETARACAFIFAFLLFPIAIYFDSEDFKSREKLLLAVLVFGQSLSMQLFGFYHW